jgi:tetratricopeptide (TPR) repeat protein
VEVAPAKLSRSRLWLFGLIAALGIPLTLFLLLEGVLRVAGYGYPTGFFLRREINGRECWVENPQFGRRFFPSAAMRTPNPLAIPIHKPTNAIRIFVLGESAALGDPLPRFGFSRMLDRLLQARFPGRQFEVVNVAMTAINSHVILPIARDCARREGDLWIVYMGNNEVVGPFGPGTVLGPERVSGAIIRANLALKRTRVGQLFDAALERLRSPDQPQYWKGMELMAERKVRRDDPRMAGVYGNFQRNLEAILRTGTQAGVPILLSTVGVNLRDCPPFASLPRGHPGADQAAISKQAYEAALAFEAEGKWLEAASQYEAILKSDSASPELHYRLARSLAALGRVAEARDHFQRAADEDALRFRADSEVNRIVRHSASNWPGRVVRLLDAEEVFAHNATNGIPGDESFYEHVHMTPKGNYLLARAAADEVARLLSLDGSRNGESSGTNAPAVTWLSQSECEDHLGYTSWNHSQALRVVLDRMQFAPFPGTIDHADRLRKLRVHVESLVSQQSPAAFQMQAEQVRRAVAAHPDDWELRENLGLLLSFARDMPGAQEQLQAAIRLMPHAPSAHFSLAGVLALQGRHDEAIRHYRECLRLKPDDFHAWMRMGIVEIERRNFAESASHLRAALRAKPDSVAARMYLGGALLQLQQRAEAQTQFREVLKIEPNNAEARQLLQTAGGTP